MSLKTAAAVATNIQCGSFGVILICNHGAPPLRYVELARELV